MADGADETVAAGIAAGRAVLGELNQTSWGQVGDKALVQAVADAHTLAVQAQAAALASLAELEKRGICQTRFGIDTAAWLAEQQHVARPTARAQVRTAMEAFVDAPTVGAALGRGELTVEHAQAIGHGLSVVPLDLPAKDELRLHEALVGYCAHFTPTEVRRLTNHAVEVIAPEAFDTWQAKILARQEELGSGPARCRTGGPNMARCGSSRCWTPWTGRSWRTRSSGAPAWPAISGTTVKRQPPRTPRSGAPATRAPRAATTRLRMATLWARRAPKAPGIRRCCVPAALSHRTPGVTSAAAGLPHPHQPRDPPAQ